MADVETTRKRRGAHKRSNGNGKAGPAATGTEEICAEEGEGVDGGLSVAWEEVESKLRELEKSSGNSRIVRVFAPCDEVPEMFIGDYASAPVEFSDKGKPASIMWNNGEIAEI